jgi:transcriptional regulator with XRE-family HTH domain
VVSGQGFVFRTRGTGAYVEREWAMRAMERRMLLRKLDKEMRHYRLAARAENPTNELLRTVRKVLRVPMKEMAEKMGIVESALFQMEEREGTGSITLRSLNRMAGAMDCKVVYGVVPLNGKTLEELAEERLWKDVLGKDSETASQQVSKSASRQVSESAIQSVEAGGAANKAAA